MNDTATELVKIVAKSSALAAAEVAAGYALLFAAGYTYIKYQDRKNKKATQTS